MKTEELEQQNNLDFEPFNEALEDDPKLLAEALEILLDMVDFEPTSIKKSRPLHQRRFAKSI